MDCCAVTAISANARTYDHAMDKYIQSVLCQGCAHTSDLASVDRSRLLELMKAGITDTDASTTDSPAALPFVNFVGGGLSPCSGSEKTTHAKRPGMCARSTGHSIDEFQLVRHSKRLQGVLGCTALDLGDGSSKGDTDGAGQIATERYDPTDDRHVGIVEKHRPISRKPRALRQPIPASSQFPSQQLVAAEFMIEALPRHATNGRLEGADGGSMEPATRLPTRAAPLKLKDVVLRKLRPASAAHAIIERLPPRRGVTPSLDWLPHLHAQGETPVVATEQGITRLQFERHLHEMRKDTWRTFAKTHDAPDTLPAVSSEGRLIGIAPAPILQLV